VKTILLYFFQNLKWCSSKKINIGVYDLLKALFVVLEVGLLEHPLYSPDLTPCDCFLFPRLKNKIDGLRISSPQQVTGSF
jgi:hypothetical protein